MARQHLCIRHVEAAAHCMPQISAAYLELHLLEHYTSGCCSSMESLDIAAEHEPSSQQTSLSEGHRLLRQEKAHKALAQLQPLMTCEDDSSKHLGVSSFAYTAYKLWRQLLACMP